MENAKVISVVLGVVLASSLYASSEPNVCEKLGLGTTQLSGATVHYEKSLEPYLPELQKAYNDFLLDIEKREAAIEKKQDILEAINQIIGDKDPASLDERRLMFFRLLGVPVSIEDPVLYFMKRDTARDYLRSAGKLPTISYNKDTDRIVHHWEDIIQNQGMQTKALELTLLVASPQQCDKEIKTFFSILEVRFGTGTVVNAVLNLLENGLLIRAKPSDPQWKWFTKGVAYAVAQNLLSEYFGQAKMEKYENLADPTQYKKYEKELNLRYWLAEDARIDAPLSYERELNAARCEYSRFEIERLIEKHGIEVISKILDRICDEQSRTSEDLIQVIEKVTGEDIQQRLRLYQSFDTTQDAVAKYAGAFNEASGRKDYEQMLVNLIRLHEIRPMLFSKTCLLDYEQAAVLLDKLGYEQDAEDNMHRCMSLYGDSPEGQLLVMQAYLMYVLDCRKPRKGLAFAEEILNHKPDNTMALAVRMLSQDDMAKAKETARVIQSLVPEDKQEESLPYQFALHVIAFDPNQINAGDPNEENQGDGK